MRKAVFNNLARVLESVEKIKRFATQHVSLLCAKLSYREIIGFLALGLSRLLLQKLEEL